MYKIQQELILLVKNQFNKKKFLILVWHMKLMLRVQQLLKLLVPQLKMQNKMMRVSLQKLSIKKAHSKCSSLGQPQILNHLELKNLRDNRILKVKIILLMLLGIVLFLKLLLKYQFFMKELLKKILVFVNNRQK